MRLLSLQRSLSLLVLGLTSTAALAQDNPGAHQHGHAQLQLALASEEVEVLLVSPAYNLLGFEHRPQTPEQIRAWEDARQWLEQIPLINTPEGRCTLSSAHVHATWPAAESAETASRHDHDQHDHQSHQGNHTDVEVTQTLNCPGLSGNPELVTGLVSQFPEMTQLNVQWVSDKGQGSERLVAKEQRFRAGR